MRSIRVKISIITIAAILTSVLSVVVACFLTIRTESKHNLTEKSNLLCENTKNLLEKYFDSIEQSVEIEASLATDYMSGIALVNGGVIEGASSALSKKTPEQVASLDDYLHDYCSKLQECSSSIASRTQGIVGYYYCINPQISVKEHGYYYSKVGKTGFSERPPIDARELDPYDLEHTTWYFTPVNRGLPAWVGPYKTSYLNEMLMISYVTPVYKAGTLVGVMGMDIPFDTIISQISPIRVYDTGFACLLDENGKILYHPELNMGDSLNITEQSVYDMLMQESSSGLEPIRYTVNDQERQMSFATLNNGMKLAIVIPTKEIYASWSRLTRIILLSTVVIITIFVFIIILAMSILISPLQHLTSASRKLAAGDYDMELPYSGQDEVGVLTEAFSKMRDHLQFYISDLKRRLYTDELTGLPNRNHFNQLSQEAKQCIIDEGKEPVLLFFNMIGLKYYNRQYGFSQGNKLLCEMAAILERHFGIDRIAHFGQGHYVAMTAEEDFRQELSGIFRECLEINDGTGIPVRVGVTPFSLGEVDVGVACDRAKYASDRHRGAYLSNYYYFTDAMKERVENSRYILNNLDRAIQNNWIQVYYQPIIRSKTGLICDEEALARWFDPVKGFISPGEFIPVLEKARLIYKLDLYVLDQIILKMKAQEEAGLPVVPHSLNLSRIDFDECDIIEEILQRIDGAEIPRNKLSIEITESVVGSDFDFIREQVLKLQNLGFLVWMDDFGSGYSSLDVLQDIHFDLIKFDMRFMHRFDEGDESKIILTQLFEMTKALNLETIAEGVETRDQVEFLTEVGCTKLQGYYFSRPIPFEELLKQQSSDEHITYENPDE